MKAWYFSGTDKKLRYGDNREISIGCTHEVEGDPVLCDHGLHGSKNILDALSYAPGPVVWKVNLSGEIAEGDDKIAAQKRTYIAGGIDISDTLRKFALLCALDVINLWDAPDIVIRYLKTGDESIRSAAMDAALAAAKDAAWAAASAAARAAAWAAAKDAAWAAAKDAAWAAARAAARSAAWAAAREKQSRRLRRMVNAEIRMNR